MRFASDNWAGAMPEVVHALARANEGFAAAYGGDGLTARVTQLFADVFERKVDVWFTATGTASNALALASLSRPGGLVLCSSEAHIDNDEWGATEFYAPGTKLKPLAATAGKIVPQTLRAALARFPPGGRHGVPVALSLTNATECGTVYSADETAVLADMARADGLAVHLDGARFANAVAATGASPADLTWRAGVDVMSFGGTKNGCWAADAVVVFSPEKTTDLAARRQRAGMTFSKARFVAAQFEAYLSEGRWLDWASRANALSDRLRTGLRQSATARLAWESTANEVFAVVKKDRLAAMRAAGGFAHEWPADAAAVPPAADETVIRLVTAAANDAAEVDRFLGMV